MNTLYPDDLPNLQVFFSDDPSPGTIRAGLKNHDALAMETTNGPPMVEHPLIRSGRPTSLWDIMGVAAWQHPLLAEQRFVPADRDFNTIPNRFNENQFEIVTARMLHAEFTKQNKWRGRPSSFTRFNIEQLVAWRNDVFKGYLTIRDLAKAAGVSEPAAARFAHGETLWYV